jgi:hypothetical protein
MIVSYRLVTLLLCCASFVLLGRSLLYFNSVSFDLPFILTLGSLSSKKLGSNRCSFVEDFSPSRFCTLNFTNSLSNNEMKLTMDAFASLQIEPGTVAINTWGSADDGTDRWFHKKELKLGDVKKTCKDSNRLGTLSDVDVADGKRDHQITTTHLKTFCATVAAGMRQLKLPATWPGGECGEYLDDAFVSDAETSILAAFTAAEEHNALEANAAPEKQTTWTDVLIDSGDWEGDGISIPADSMTDELWKNIYLKIREMDLFAYTVLFQCSTEFWQSKITVAGDQAGNRTRRHWHR